MKKLLLASLALVCALDLAHAQGARLADRDIIDAYSYMVGRWLVLRREAADLKEGFRWNEIVHRAPAGTDAADPDFDVVTSEAWIAVDENSCTIVDLPEIKGRYFTLQVLNGWGEVTANINDRTFPKRPSGKFALCIKPAKVTLPKGTVRINLPSRKSHVVFRIELGANPAEALALQKKVTLKATGTPVIAPMPAEFGFSLSELPGIEAFEKTDDILESEDDVNIGMVGVQETAEAIAAAMKNPAERARIDEVVRRRAIPNFLGEAAKIGKPVNGWVRPPLAGNYRSDYETRSAANYAGAWANSGREMTAFTALNLDGSQTYTQTFPADALPATKARYLWSLTAVDTADRRAIQNSLNRHHFNRQSNFTLNDDGSLTLIFAPKLPADAPESNWIPTTPGKKYNIVYRFYGPTKDVYGGAWYPPTPVLVKSESPSRLRQFLRRN